MEENRFNTVEEALEALRNGKVIVVLDSAERENEGDLICAARHAPRSRTHSQKYVNHTKQEYSKTQSPIKNTYTESCLLRRLFAQTRRKLLTEIAGKRVTLPAKK